jgi:signal transduction histidine kinase
LDGSITIHTIQEKDKTYIDVTDTGKGMFASEFDRIFEPGYTTKKRGWGLGLSLCKRIVEEYFDGRIFVKSSKPNFGTTIRIILDRK